MNSQEALKSEKPDKRAFKVQESYKALGGAGNVAANLASLGVNASLVGVTGNISQYWTFYYS